MVKISRSKISAAAVTALVCGWGEVSEAGTVVANVAAANWLVGLSLVYAQEEETEPATEEDLAVEDVENVQEGGPAQETQEMDPETQKRLQELFLKVSDECKAEVQTAYSEGRDISNECKEEIQKVMTAANPNDATAGAAGKKSAPKDPSADPTFTIVGFVGLMFAGLVGWGVYAQQNLLPQEDGQKKRKLSKQKQLKERMKMQRENKGIN